MARTDIVKYQTDEKTTGVAIIAGMKVSASVKALIHAFPADSLPEGFFLVDLTRNAKSCGLSPRGFICNRESGNGPKSFFLPCPTKADYDGKNDGDTVAAYGGNYKITKKAEKGYK